MFSVSKLYHSSNSTSLGAPHQYISSKCDWNCQLSVWISQYNDFDWVWLEFAYKSQKLLFWHYVPKFLKHKNTFQCCPSILNVVYVNHLSMMNQPLLRKRTDLALWLTYTIIGICLFCLVAGALLVHCNEINPDRNQYLQSLKVCQVWVGSCKIVETRPLISVIYTAQKIGNSRGSRITVAPALMYSSIFLTLNFSISIWFMTSDCGRNVLSAVTRLLTCVTQPTR